MVKNRDLLLDDKTIAKILDEGHLDFQIEELPHTISIEDTKTLIETFEASYLDPSGTVKKERFKFVEKDGVRYLAEAGDEVFASLTNKMSSLNLSTFSKIEGVLKSKPTIVRFDYGGRVAQTSEQFLRTVGDDFYDIVYKNGAYAKFDKSTGRMLYVEGDFHALVRYTQGNNVSNVKALIADRVTKMRNLLGYNGPQTITLFDGTILQTAKTRVTTIIGKTDQTRILKNQFGDFKHVQVGETKGAVNLLNRSDVNWIGKRWWKDYNKAWMLRAIKRGDDIYIASPIKKEALFNIDKASNKRYGSYYSRELYELVKAGVKPKNIIQAEWNKLIPDIKKAALTNIPY